ncbi:MAG: hypothetical protein JM58_05135 [Peptococcaceae bacterium BICA1-8]|nr:MAG: hypothetical protein JM58_05135 [Peptococcaceae bacterium BICA1-8]
MTTKPIYYFWSFILAIFTLLGFLLLYFRTTQGLLVTNLNNITGWGLWVSFYVFFIGLSVGSYLIFSLGYVLEIEKYKSVGRLALYSSLISLITGFMFIFIDIGHMGRFWTVFLNRNKTSVLSWELQLYVVYLIVIFMQLWFLLRKDIISHLIKGNRSDNLLVRLVLNNKYDFSGVNWDLDLQKIKRIGYVGIPLAIAVHGGTGAIFAVLKARSFWNTGLFPVVFLVSALVSGFALQIFLSSLLKKKNIDLIRSLYKVLMILIVFDLLLFISQFIVSIYSELPAQTSIIKILTTGAFSNLFWLGQIGAGILVPVIIFIFQNNGRLLFYTIGSLSSLIGVFITRMNLIIPQLTIPVLAGLVEAYESNRVTTMYKPSSAEWLFSIAILLFSVILFIYGLHLLPITADKRYE